MLGLLHRRGPIHGSTGLPIDPADRRRVSQTPSPSTGRAPHPSPSVIQAPPSSGLGSAARSWRSRSHWRPACSAMGSFGAGGASRKGWPIMTAPAEKAETFPALHSQTFVIPNPWDAGSARVLAGMGFKALATTSSGSTFTLGDWTVASLSTRWSSTPLHLTARRIFRYPWISRTASEPSHPRV